MSYGLLPTIIARVLRCVPPLLAVVLAGCATSVPVGQALDPAGIAALNSRSADEQYRLAPGDRISIRFHYSQQFDEDLTIRPDGRISLPMIAEMPAAGRTPQELGRALSEAYAKALGTDSEHYVLGVGERLSIKSFYHEKLNEDVVIRPDGRISMQLVGEVRAAGVTPARLAEEIAGRLRKYVDAPEISVIVREVRRPDLSVVVRASAAQRVFIGGEVRQAGVLALDGRLGLLAATLQAGGLLETARAENVMVLRHAGTGEPAIYSIDMNAILRGETQDLALRPMDVVYVPKTAVAETAAALRQNIYNMLPAQFQATLGYQINPRVDVTNGN